MIRTLLLCALPSLALASGPSWSQLSSTTSWKELATKSHPEAGEVTIFSTTLSGVACFKGQANTTLSPDALFAVVDDIPGSTSWSSAGLREAEELSRSGNKVHYFQYLDVPGWTFSSDRFWFLEGTIESSETSKVFRWDRLQDGGPHAARFSAVREANPKAIEPPINVGAWTFTREGETTLVKYEVCTDSGGSIPAALQATATRKTLPDTVGDVIREAGRRSR